MEFEYSSPTGPITGTTGHNYFNPLIMERVTVPGTNSVTTDLTPYEYIKNQCHTQLRSSYWVAEVDIKRTSFSRECTNLHIIYR